MEWSSYQSDIFKAVSEMQNSLLVEAVAGCLAGPTQISVNRGGKSYNCTIEHLVAMMNGERRSGKIFNPDIPTRVRSYDPLSSAVRLAVVARAVYSGIKQTYLLKADGGFSLRATADHKIMTTAGWLRLGDISVGNSILVDGGKGYREDGETPSKPSYKYVYRMDAHPFRSVTHNRGVAYYRIPLHRLAMEAWINDVEFEIFQADVQAGELRDYEFLDPMITQVHHIDEDSQNNQIGNLVVMSEVEHHRHHGLNGGWEHVQAFVTSAVVTFIGAATDEDTYDLTMENGDQPNFLANGIVVHNSGKTTTLVELINRIPKGQRVIFLAFNKAIATELERRVDKTRAECRTLHSVGNSAWKSFLDWDANNCELDSRKTFKIIDDRLSWPQRQRYAGQMAKLISIAKGAGIVPGITEFDDMKGLTDDDEAAWEDLIDFYDLDLFVLPGGEMDKAGVQLAREVLTEGIRRARTMIDFDDQLYMPVVMGAKFEQYDVVLLDEAQDVNSMQVEIVARLLAPDARVIACGDKNQAIYGFRGCLSSSMEHIAERFKCRELPLSISYRCPKLIVAEAQRYVGHILPFENAPAGHVSTEDQWSGRDFRSADVVLCRLNAPLVTLAFYLIRNKVACRIAGRDIATGLTALVKKMRATDVNDLLGKLSKFRAREVLKAKDDPGKLARTQDKLDTLHVFIDELGMDDSVEDLIASIERMFTDTAIAGLLTLSTVHKAKGLEWSRVFILDAEDLMPLPWAREGWQLEQEYNLLYVAITRAKSELRYITSEGLGIVTRKKARAGA